MSVEDVYYVFFDSDNTPYFYHHQTENTTYDKPAQGVFLDPNTNELFDFSRISGAASETATSHPIESETKHKPKTKKVKKIKRSKSKEVSDRQAEQPPPEDQNQQIYTQASANPPEENHVENQEYEQPQPAEPEIQNVQPVEVQHPVEVQQPEEAQQPEIDQQPAPQEESEPVVYDGNTDIYYVFLDGSNIPYYYHNVTQATTYDKPSSGVFLDPNTNKPFDFTPYVKPKRVIIQAEPEPQPQEKPTPDLSAKSRKSKHHHSSHRGTVSMTSSPAGFVIDIPREVRHPRKERRATLPPRKSFFPNAESLSLPTDIKQDIQKFQVNDYARKFFKEHRERHFFTRRKISAETMSQFQDDPIKDSLLSSLSKNNQKDAIELFKLILAYTGAAKDSKPKPSAADAILQLVSRNPVIRDELFFQLIKQTNNNPNESCLVKTWELFVVAATVFPSSRDSEVWIKSHLAREAAKDTNKQIADMAQFSYIRFSSRCVIGKPMEIAGFNFVKKIIRDPFESKRTFGASIYEQLWNQRISHKLFPIPYVLHHLCELLLEKGCEQHEGIFRLPGNGKIIKQMQDKANTGGTITLEYEMNDIASLLKSWFAELPDKLIPNEMTPQLMTAYEDGKYVEFVGKLPKAHMFTLKYLIGFFQRMVKAEPVTKMGAQNLAICFGPNVIYSGNVTDLADFEKFKNISISFLTNLIENLKTDDIYPIPPELLI